MRTNSNIEGAGRSFGSAVRSITSTTALLLWAAVTLTAQAGADIRAPEVPDEIVVDGNNKVHFHGFGVGFQIYTWNGTSWGNAVPEATLFDEDGNIVSTHFAGPSWQSNSGSKVVGALPPA